MKGPAQYLVKFNMPTPLGTSNPDWAVLFDVDGTERLYFVMETKSTLITAALRPIEEGKTKCGNAHFASLSIGELPARYIVAHTVSDMLAETGD